MKCKLRERVLAVSTSIMLMLCIFISSGYTQTVNAEALPSIELEFGEGHEVAAQKSKVVFESKGYTSELEGTTLIVDWLPGASEKDTRDAITEIIRSAL